MADQDQQAPTNDQSLPAGNLPGSAFTPPPVDPGERPLPGYFFNLPKQGQQDYLANPDTLPRDLPERTLKTVGRALPYAAATGAGLLLAPEVTIPYLGTTLPSLLAGGAIVGGAQGAGSLAQSAIYKGINDPDAPATIEEAVKRAGVEAAWGAATEIGFRGAGEVLGKALKKAFNPESMYQRGLKPPAGRGQRVSGEIVKTGIEERIPLSEGGAEKLAGLIDTVNDDIEKMITTSPTDIPPAKYLKNIETRFEVLRNKYSKRALSGGKSGTAVATIDEAERRFLANHGNVKPLYQWKGGHPGGVTNPLNYRELKPEKMTLRMLRERANPISSLDAQAIKRETYEELRSIYKARGQNVNIPGWAAGTHPDVVTDVTQELTRALREELGNIYPGLHKLNARDGRLLDLDESVNRFINREMNRGLWRWGAALMSGGLTGGLGHVARGGGADLSLALPSAIGLTTAGLIKGALDDPAILSYLSIAVAGAREMPGKGIVVRLGREALPTYARKVQYERTKAGEHEQPWKIGPAAEAAPAESSPAAEAAPAAEAEPAAPQDTTRAPLKLADQAVLDRERQMNFSPTYGWSNEEERMLQDASQRVGVPLSLLHVLAEREGSGHAAENQKVPARMVRSDAGAVGLMQIMPDTARTYGYQPEEMTDAYKNIDVAARFAKDLNSRPEYRARPGLVLAAYAAGPETLKRAGYMIGRLSPVKREYVVKGMKRWAELSLPPDQAEWFIANRIPSLESFEK